MNSPPRSTREYPSFEIYRELVLHRARLRHVYIHKHSRPCPLRIRQDSRDYVFDGMFLYFPACQWGIRVPPLWRKHPQIVVDFCRRPDRASRISRDDLLLYGNRGRKPVM